MTVENVQKIIEKWAPPDIAWEQDNIGLQIGSGKAKVKGIHVCLDVNENTVSEAGRRRANLIISHHPLLFRRLESVDLRNAQARHIEQILRANISLISAHTNLDFCRGGTSFALAERLDLDRVDFLRKTHRLSKKIVTFVPPEHADRVAHAMGSAGAGKIGNYESCSFRSQGIGTFKGNTNSKPTIGTSGKFEQTGEMRLEMIVDQPNIRSVIEALQDAHPYEEVAYDVYPVENVSEQYGMGIIGELRTPMPLDQFLAHVKGSLGCHAVRYTRGRTTRICKVAACGGSGSDLTDEAIRQGADAFITADVKYHSFQDAARRIVLIDAGHYETERPVVESLVRRLKREFKRTGKRCPVYASRTSTNPIVYH